MTDSGAYISHWLTERFQIKKKMDRIINSYELKWGTSVWICIKLNIDTHDYT